MDKGCPHCAKMKSKMKGMQDKLDAANQEEEEEADAGPSGEGAAMSSGINDLPEVKKAMPMKGKGMAMQGVPMKGKGY